MLTIDYIEQSRWSHIPGTFTRIQKLMCELNNVSLAEILPTYGTGPTVGQTIPHQLDKD